MRVNVYVLMVKDGVDFDWPINISGFNSSDKAF